MQAIPALLSIVGTVFKFKGERDRGEAQEAAAEQQRAAAQEAERIGMKNAAAQEAETAESVRRETVAASEAAADRKVRAAASGGALTGGSTGAFLDEQSSRDANYIDWLKKSGASRADIEREKAEYAGMEGSIAADMTRQRAENTKLGSLGTLIGGAASIYDIYN